MPDLLLYFPPNKRPTGESFAAAIQALPEVSITAEGAESTWVELHCSGLTFDCTGLAPGPTLDARHKPNWLGEASARPSESTDHIALGLGPHVRAGQGLLPILRGLLSVAVKLARHLDGCLGVQWLASGQAVGTLQFEEAISGMESTDALPMALLLAVNDGQDGQYQTTGLAYFTGQELRLEAGVAADGSQSAILAQRIAAHLIHRGKLDQVEATVSPDGTPLQIAPSADGTLVMVHAS